MTIIHGCSSLELPWDSLCTSCEVLILNLHLIFHAYGFYVNHSLNCPAVDFTCYCFSNRNYIPKFHAAVSGETVQSVFRLKSCEWDRKLGHLYLRNRCFSYKYKSSPWQRRKSVWVGIPHVLIAYPEDPVNHTNTQCNGLS